MFGLGTLSLPLIGSKKEEKTKESIPTNNSIKPLMIPSSHGQCNKLTNKPHSIEG